MEDIARWGFHSPKPVGRWAGNDTVKPLRELPNERPLFGDHPTAEERRMIEEGFYPAYNYFRQFFAHWQRLPPEVREFIRLQVFAKDSEDAEEDSYPNYEQ